MLRRIRAAVLLCVVGLAFLGTGVASALPGSNIAVQVNIIPTTVNPGTEFNASLFIQNLGDDPANTLSLTGTVPPNTTFVSLAGGCCGQTINAPPLGGTGAFSVFIPGFHNPGAGTSYTLRQRVNCGVPAGTVLFIPVTGSTLSNDPVPGNNTGTDSITVGNDTSACGGGGGAPPNEPTGVGPTDFGVKLPGDDILSIVNDVCRRYPNPNPGPVTIPSRDPYGNLVNSDGTPFVLSECSSCVPAQPVHEEIADLLERLRRLQDLQVTVEVRFITITDDFFECLGVDSALSVGAINRACGEDQRTIQEWESFLNGVFPIVPSPSPSVIGFNSVEGFNRCARNLGIPSVYNLAPAAPNQFRALILPFMEKTFCGGQFGSGFSVSRLGLPLINENVFSLNRGALGNGQGFLGSNCFTIADNRLNSDFGNLTLLTKHALLNDCTTGDVFSAGLTVTVPTGNAHNPACPILGSIPQIVTIQNLGANSGDVQVTLQPSDNAALLGVLVPLPDPTSPDSPANAPTFSFLPATVSSPATVTAATVAGATVSSSSPTSGRGRTLSINGLAPGQQARLLVLSAAPLPQVGQTAMFTATITSAQDTNAANNSVTLVVGLTSSAGSAPQAPKPVAPQIFQNPGAIAIVQQRPTPTPTPRPIR